MRTFNRQIIRTITFTVLVFVFVIQISGCATTESSIAGTYHLDKDDFRNSMKEHVEAQGLNVSDSSIAMTNSVDMTLALNKDGTAVLLSHFAGDSSTETGNWVLDDDSLILDLKDTASPLCAVDGNTIRFLPLKGAMFPFEFVFRKSHH